MGNGKYHARNIAQSTQPDKMDAVVSSNASRIGYGVDDKWLQAIVAQLFYTLEDP